MRATLREAVTVNDEIVLPAGTELTGNVTDVEGSGRVKGRARIALPLHVAPRWATSGTKSRPRRSRIEAEATKGEDAKKIGIGAGIGAAWARSPAAATAPRRVPRSAARGGTGVVLATKGKEVRLGAGANVSTRLTAPLTVQLEIMTAAAGLSVERRAVATAWRMAATAASAPLFVAERRGQVGRDRAQPARRRAPAVVAPAARRRPSVASSRAARVR